jgi:hypothetical protein
MKVWEKLIKKAIHISRMSSLEHLRKVVRNLADTINNPQIRESSYFDFYDDSLIIHVSLQIFQSTRKVSNNSFISCGRHFLI